MTMGKRKAKGKGRARGKASLAGLLVALLCGCFTFFSEINETQTKQEHVAVENVTPASGDLESQLEIHFMDVGQGDATLLICDGEAMLIDAGDNNKGTEVQLYLKKRGVDKLKYAIGTHPDADHIGGLDVVLQKIDCDKIIMPDVSKDTATYRDVVDIMKYKGYRNTLPEVGDTYTLGQATFTILGPVRKYSDTNNNSVVILLEHGQNTFLFTGDAEEEAEYDIVECGIDIDADVLKVGHHGSKTASSESFLEEVSPQYAVISCGEKNDYGHPHAEPLNNLRSMGVKVFRTDEQGSIVVSSNGTELVWNCSPSESWQVGE